MLLTTCLLYGFIYFTWKERNTTVFNAIVTLPPGVYFLSVLDARGKRQEEEKVVKY